MRYQFLRYIFLVLSLLCIQEAIAQQDFYGGYSPAINAAPTTAKTTKASSATVDLTTGAVQYAVPIYTIQQNGVSWSTGLQYHYSGLKVMEEPSSIGLGWSLIATGMISREVRGLPDDHPRGYHGSENLPQTILDPYYNFDPNNSSATNGKKVLKEHHAFLLANGLVDGEPDLFTVNAGQLNFSFKIGKNGQPVLLSHHNVKVTFGWDSIEVIDGEGVKYIFAAKEIYDPVLLNTVMVSTPYNEFVYTRSWYLTAIQPPNTTQQIVFEYQNHLKRIKDFVPTIYSHKRRKTEFLSNLDPNETAPDASFNPYIYQYTRMDVDISTPILSKITFTEGSLHFNRLSLPAGSHPQYSSIELKDYNNSQIHYYDLYTKQSRRLLTEIKQNNELVFRFEYYNQNGTSAIPDFDSDKDKITSTMDPWGYYGGTQTTEYQTEIMPTVYPSFEGTLHGALKTISYKTGGQTQIEYELNKIPMHIDVNSRNINGWEDFNRDFYISDFDSNPNGKKTRTTAVRVRTFTEPTFITISHSASISKYGSRVKLKIQKQGYTGAYVPYYDCANTNGIAQLDINEVGERENLLEGKKQYDSSGECSFTIAPGTYTFYLETEKFTSAMIVVKYPSGNVTHRKESYDYDYGGLRVRSIKNCPANDGKCTKKQYQYTNDLLVSSAKIHTTTKKQPAYYYYDMAGDPNSGVSQYSTEENKIAYPFFVRNQGLPIYYAQVSEMASSADPMQEVINGRIVYTFEDPYIFESSADLRQEEYNNPIPQGIIEGGIRTKSVKTYKNIDNNSMHKEQLLTEQFYEYEPVQMSRDEFGHSLDTNYPYGIKVRPSTGVKRKMSLEEYVRIRAQEKNMLDHSLSLLLADYNEYYHNRTQAEYRRYAEGLIARTGVTVGSYHYTQMVERLPGVGVGGSDQNKHYTIKAYKETNAQPRQKRVVYKTYSDIDPATYTESIQEYIYDQNNQVETQIYTDSKKDTKKSIYYYPYHPSINNTTLMSANRIVSPVKTETFKGTQKQGTAHIHYTTKSTGYYLPSLIQAAKEGAAMRDQTIYHKYDAKGNPLEVSRGKEPHTVYIWGYNDVYPIARIDNATYDQVAGFVPDLKAKSNADIDRAKGYDGTEGALRQALDGLRDALPGAIVTTYTYDPLIGVTSTTDPRGYTSYTEYDALYRLMQIRDADNNIINKYYYNNKGIEYAPMQTSITSEKNWIDVHTSMQIQSTVSGGSGQFTYVWKVTKPGNVIEHFSSKDIILQGGGNGGMVTVELTVTDGVTGKTKTVSKSISIYDEISSAASQISLPATHVVQTTAAFNINPQGGSGNYTYSWKISRGGVNHTTTQKSFSLTMECAYYGQVQVECTVQDTITGNSKTVTTTMNVVEPAPLTLSIASMPPVSSAPRTQKFQVLANINGGLGNYTYSWYVNGGRVGSSSSIYVTLYCGTTSNSAIVDCTVTDTCTGRVVSKRGQTYTISSSRCRSTGGGSGGGNPRDDSDNSKQ